MKLNWLLTGLSACALTSLAISCGKKEFASGPVNEAKPAATNNPSATPSERDMVISERSIDYVQGLITRKQFQQASEALKQVEARPLTAAQRQRVEELKARIPKN